MNILLIIQYIVVIAALIALTGITAYFWYQMLTNEPEEWEIQEDGTSI